MARPKRLEDPGTCDDVINRSNDGAAKIGTTEGGRDTRVFRRKPCHASEGRENLRKQIGLLSQGVPGPDHGDDERATTSKAA